MSWGGGGGGGTTIGNSIIALIPAGNIQDAATHVLWTGYLDTDDFAATKTVTLDVVGSVTGAVTAMNVKLIEADGGGTAAAVAVVAASPTRYTAAATISSTGQLYNIEADLDGWVAAPDAGDYLSVLLRVA